MAAPIPASFNVDKGLDGIMAITIEGESITAGNAVLPTSKSGTLLLRRDQGEMAVFWDSRSRRL
jgi:hypothetical protein